MTAYDFVHLALFAMDGKIQGKTKLQKTVYFLGVLTGQLDSLGYRAHYYGPYSGVVRDATNRLRALGFIAQNSVPFGSRDPQGFEMARHDFELTQDGRSIAEQKATTMPAEWAKIQEATETLKKAGDRDYMFMSVAAKTFFIVTGKGGRSTIGEIEAAAKDLGWNPSVDDIKKAAEYLQHVGLVEAG